MKKLIVCVLSLVLLAGCAVNAETGLNENYNQQCTVQKNENRPNECDGTQKRDCINECDGTQKRECTNNQQCQNNGNCNGNGDCLQYRHGQSESQHSNCHHSNH